MVWLYAGKLRAFPHESAEKQADSHQLSRSPWEPDAEVGTAATFHLEGILRFLK